MQVRIMEELTTLRNYTFRNYNNESHSIWNKLPVSRRSAVFILLFLGNFGELRVVLTKRSSKLRNFPGHISLPGGKSDNGLESEWQTARREMEEEIGLSANNKLLKEKYGFEIEHLNIMPSYLSRTFSAVRPCIGFMKFSPELSDSDLIHNLKVSLNPGESSGVFSCPLRDFLYPITDEAASESVERESFKLKWGGIPFHLRSYTFPQTVKGEASWLKDVKDLSDSDLGSDSDMDQLEAQEQNAEQEEEEEAPSQSSKSKAMESKKSKLEQWGRLGSRRHSHTNEKIFDVWGLTANILHDLSNITYTKNAINKEIGEEQLIYSVWEHGGQMKTRSRSEAESKLIESKSIAGEFGFNDILPRTEFNKLKRLYKV